MADEEALSSVINKLAAKLVLCKLEAEAQEERRQGRSAPSSRGGRGLQRNASGARRPVEDRPGTGSKSDVRHGASRPGTASKSDVRLGASRPGTASKSDVRHTQEFKAGETRSSQLRSRHGRLRNKTSCIASPDFTSWNKAMSTLSIVDLMYRVEDALRWDKFSTKTKIMVEKFREELNKKYLEREEPADVRVKRRRAIRKLRASGGSGLQDDIIQEVEQVLTLHLANKLPKVTTETFQPVVDIPSQWEAFRNNIPDLGSLNTNKSEATFSKSKRKKIQSPGSRRQKKLLTNMDIFVKTIKPVTKHRALQSVPILVGHEESLSSIHYEKEPETYITLGPNGDHGNIEPEELNENAEDLSKMVEDVTRLCETLLRPVEDENENTSIFQSHQGEIMEFNSDDGVWLDAQSTQGNGDDMLNNKRAKETLENKREKSPTTNINMEEICTRLNTNSKPEMDVTQWENPDVQPDNKRDASSVLAVTSLQDDQEALKFCISECSSILEEPFVEVMEVPIAKMDSRSQLKMRDFYSMEGAVNIQISENLKNPEIPNTCNEIVYMSPKRTMETVPIKKISWCLKKSFSVLYHVIPRSLTIFYWVSEFQLTRTINICRIFHPKAGKYKKKPATCIRVRSKDGLFSDPSEYRKRILSNEI